MHKFIGAALVVLILFTAATADEFTGIVTKFEGGKITVNKHGGGGPPPPESIVVLTVDAKCKFMKSKYNKEKKTFEADGELEGGKALFAKLVKDVADKKVKGFGGVIARIITTGEGSKATVTEIRVTFPKQ